MCIPVATDGVFFISLAAPTQDGPPADSSWPLAEFVGDAENALVRVAAEAALAPAPRFNPLVLCGPTGVGKSHLLCGLTQRWRAEHPEAKAVLISGADFARSYANAVDTDTLADHRERLTQAAWLAVDGLEELRKKPAAQHELARILDAALAAGAQVVVASREPLSPGGALAPGLASRLAGGLVVPVAPPGLAARQALLEKTAAAISIAIDAEAVSLLASKLKGTAPELRNAVLQLHQQACESAADDRPINVAMVRRFLAERTEAQRPTLNKIAAQVARRYRLKTAELQSKTRRREVVQARGVAMLLARQLTGASYKTLGRHFGGRDHSTAMHACRRLAEQLRTDAALKRTLEELASPWAG